VFTRSFAANGSLRLKHSLPRLEVNHFNPSTYASRPLPVGAQTQDISHHARHCVRRVGNLWHEHPHADDAQGVSGQPAGRVGPGGRDRHAQDWRDILAKNLLNKIRMIEGVRAVSGLLSRTVNVPDRFFGDSKITALTLVGLDPRQVQRVRTYRMQEGRFLRSETTWPPSSPPAWPKAWASSWATSCQLGQAVFNLFGFFALIMGGFIIFNTFRTVVAERRHDIGMLRAVGATRPQVRRIVIAEALLLAAIGTALGLLAGLLSYVMVLMSTLFPMAYSFPLGGVVAVAGGLIFGVIAALIPARQAAGMEIVRALQYE